MPGLFYSSDRVWQVIAYIRSFSQHPSAEPSGDHARGRTLFASSGCANCHRIQGRGGLTGPDLTNVGKMRSAHHLREAITNPGADVRQRYWVVDLITDEGKSIGGFLMNEDTYSVQFINSSGQLQSYSKSGLKSYKVEKVSKMPSYQDRLGKKEVDDVVAYLSSLRPNTGVRNDTAAHAFVCDDIVRRRRDHLSKNFNADKDAANWLTYSGNYKGWRYSPLDQITVRT